MIIKATNKLLNISRIKPEKCPIELTDKFPGEWYANLISQLVPGKFVIHFLHNPTFISILVPGKSIQKASISIPDRARDLLMRHGFKDIVSRYSLASEIKIYKSDNRSIQGNLNNMKYDIEYQFSRYFSDEMIDLAEVEDLEMDYIFGGKNIKGYKSPIRILKSEL